MDILGLKSGWRDWDNYRDWQKTIRREEEDPNSLFNKYNMGRNVFYNVYTIVSLAPENSVLAQNIQRVKVIEALTPINRYLDENLKFAEYLSPEISQISQDGELTLNYLVVYRFMFQKLSLKWILWRAGLLGGLTFAGFKVPWESLVTWISNLI